MFPRLLVTPQFIHSALADSFLSLFRDRNNINYYNQSTKKPNMQVSRRHAGPQLSIVIKIETRWEHRMQIACRHSPRLFFVFLLSLLSFNLNCLCFCFCFCCTADNADIHLHLHWMPIADGCLHISCTPIGSQLRALSFVTASIAMGALDAPSFRYNTIQQARANNRFTVRLMCTNLQSPSPV